MPSPPRCGPAGIWCWSGGAAQSPAAAKRGDDPLRAFEETIEPLGHTALAIQVLTRLWMGWIVRSGFQGLLNPAKPIGMRVGVTWPLAAKKAAKAGKGLLSRQCNANHASIPDAARDLAKPPPTRTGRLDTTGKI
jgi:hypothetical protein